jgi:hypothetical protein
MVIGVIMGIYLGSRASRDGSTVEDFLFTIKEAANLPFIVFVKKHREIISFVAWAITLFVSIRMFS